MKKVTAYNDPTFSGTKNSNIVYPRKMTKSGKLIGYNTDGSEILDTDTYDKAASRVTNYQTPAQKLGNIKSPTFNPNNLKVNLPETPKTDLSGLNDLMPYASNIVNSFRKLPTPKQAGFEDTINPNLVNLDAARNNIDVDRRNLDRETDYRITNPAVAQALKASTLGRVIEGKNSLAMNEANTNAQIKNQTSQFNQGVQARNLGRKQTYLDNLTARQIEGQNLQADNLADVGDKYQLQQRDKRAFELEQRKLDYLPDLYEKDASGTSVYDREYKKQKENIDKEGKRYGGKIKRFRNYFKQY